MMLVLLDALLRTDQSVLNGVGQIDPPTQAIEPSSGCVSPELWISKNISSFELSMNFRQSASESFLSELGRAHKEFLVFSFKVSRAH